MKTNRFMRILLVVSVLALCMLGICSAAVSVEDVTSVVGPQVNLTAEVTDMEASSYQWYTCEDAEGTNPKAIEGATNAIYTTPYLDVAGDTYYMVKVNGTESAVATVTATMPEEPIVVKFNNAEDLKYWTGISDKLLTTYNGNKVYSYAATSADGLTYLAASVFSDMYIQGYPYVIVGSYHPGTSANLLDIYLGTDRVPDDQKSYGFSASFSGMHTVCGGDFSKVLVDVETRDYYVYNGDTVVRSGKASGDGFGGFDKWMGKLTSFRVDFSNQNLGKVTYIDYLGFFPTKEMAIAYAGEMPNDAEAKAIIDVIDAEEIAISYTDGATKDSADAYIAALIEEITADAISDIKASGISNVTVKVTDTKYAPGKTSKDNGEYTFTVDILVGDKALRRTDLQKEYTVAIEGKPVTNVFIDDVYVGLGNSAILTAEISNITPTSYQWYTCDDADGTNPVAIEGATAASYTTPVFDDFGGYYYMLVVNGTESGTAAITVGMPTEPVVLRFNNEQDLKNWSANQPSIKIVDGKKVFSYIAEDGDASTTFNNLSNYNNFNLQGYPYFVLSAEYPEEEYEDVGFDIYIGADGYDEEYRKNNYGFNYSIVGVKPAMKSGICKTIINGITGEFESYCDGVIVKSGTGSNDGFKDFDSLLGKLAVLRVDFINYAANTGLSCNIEYLGFFPTKEMALAYDGTMPYDDEAEAVIDAIDEAYEKGSLNVAYENAATEEDVKAYLEELIKDVAADEIAAAGVTVKMTLTNTKYTAGSTVYDDGSYAFTLDMLVGDKMFGRSSIIKEYNVVLYGKSMGKVYVPDTTIAVGGMATLAARLNGIEGNSYQWYTVSDAEGANPVAIEGANSASLNTGYLNTKGTYFYKVVVNGVESAIAKVTVDAPTKPVVLMFNNKADLAYWGAGDTKKLVNIDGKTAFAYTPNSNDGVTTFSSLSKYNDFNLQGYPYFVVSASYPEHVNLTLDIYIGADGYDAEYRKNHYGFNFSVSGVKPAADQGFCKTVINAFTGAYKSYNKDGKVVSEGKGSPDGFKSADTLLGKLASLRVDFSNQNANKECYIEYLGFFPTEEMAIAYNGEMPEDASAKILTDAVEAAEEKGDFALRFSEAEKEDAVAAKAAAKVAALTADTIAQLKEKYETVEFTVANEEYVRPAPYGMGTYNFDAQALVGDKIFGRSLVSTKVSMELGEKPEPVVLKFDTEDKVKGSGVGSVASFVAKGTTLAGNTEAEDRSYMRLDIPQSSSNVEVIYNNFNAQTGGKFNFQDYPYMKISYRRDMPTSLNGTEAIMIYATKNSPSYFIYPTVKANTAPYWEQLIVDMRQNDVTNGITYYQEAAGTTTAGTLKGHNKDRNWADTPLDGTNPLVFRLTRYGSAARVIDYEYIAFFASKDEAMMFPRELPNNASYDVETLSAKNTFAAATGVISKAQAEEAAANYLKNFVFATKANIDYENAVFTAPSSDAPGSYVFDVWFGTERKEEFTVRVTMTMAQLPKPVIMFADSTAVFNSVKADNASLKLEDGVIKMKVSNPANDDGFFLLTKHPGSMPVFEATTRPYLKMRYSISGITKDTSGNPVNPAGVQAQFFIWFNQSFNAVPYKSYYPYNSNFEDGDEIELIVDTSYVTAENRNKPGMWVRNITKGETEYTAKTVSYRNEDNSTNSSPNGSGAIRNANSSFKEVRINLARVKNLNRSAEFVYAGYFASLDEAMAFDSDAAVAEKLQAAENKLRALANSDVVIPWAEIAKERTEVPDSKATLDADGNFVTTGVKTQTVMALLGLRQWVNSYIGAEGNVEISNYVPATTTTKGSITFSMDLESAYQTRTVENVTANFSEKPDDYFVWRFNDPALASKGLASTSDNRVMIEDNLLKIDHNNPITSGNFTITVKPSDFGDETFNFESHSYILMKYKRMGDISPASFTFTNTKGETANIGNVGWGWYSDNWYYTLYDTNIRDRITPHSYNYNIDTGKLEDIHYHQSYAAPTAAPFKGDVKSITFDFGNRWFADRAMEIEFIAFFPSMADARNYVQNIEALEDARSDAVFDMAGYTADTVSFYDGNTQAIAEKKAKEIIEDKISAPNVDVTVNTVSYTVPGEADGSYVFNAVVTLNGEQVYTTENITLTISKDINNSPVVYKFTNPRFIREIKGASGEYDFNCMTLTGNSFTLEVGADKPNVVSDAYNTLVLDAVIEDGFTAIINGSERIVYEGSANGAVYLDLGEFNRNIDTIKVQFAKDGAKVRAIGFFADEAAAQAYDFNAIPEALAAAATALGGNHSYTYQHSKTISDIYAHSNDGYIRGIIANNDILVADVEVTKYEHSTTTEFGYAEVTAILGYGDKTATQYITVTYPVTLAKDEEVITATPRSEGHEFLGYDIITANNNFTVAPQTVEFNIKIASDKLFGTMTVLTNGSANISIVDGKIVVNGSISSSKALTPNEWTHVAITSDGKLYINGALDTTGSAVSFYSNAPVIGGGTSAGKGFVGHLLDLRFWNDIRTAEEIAANKTTRTGSDGLLANWMLNAENYKWLEYFDSSANNNTATFKSYGWYKMEAGWQGDYSFIHYGDTQSHFAIAPRSYKRIPDVFEWIGNNVEKYNIAHVSILGDATQNNTMFEWGVIREAHRFIDGKTTYHLPLGNHDYPSPSGGVGAEIRDTSHYRATFPYEEYLEIYGPDGMDTFGGTFRDEKDLTNMYNLVTVGDAKYIFFSLEYGPRDAVLEWVGDVLTQYPDRQGIISTHCYFSMDGTLTTRNSTTNREFSDGNEGLAMYQKLVTKYPNIIIVDCGHSQGDDSKQHPHQRGSSYKDSPTADDFGNDVVQILSDASAYALEYLKNDVAFGADEGLIFVMMFEDGGRTMHTYVYSPLHDAYFRSVNEQTHTIKEIKTEPALNVIGTEMREQSTKETLGMRFKMTLSKGYENFDDEVEVLGYGVVAVPEDLMEEGMEVTADMFEGTANAQFVKVEECNDTIFYEDDSKIDYTVVIHDVPTDDGGFAYARQFKARAYVDYTVNGGEVQRLYSFKTLTCSMNSLIND